MSIMSSLTSFAGAAGRALLGSASGGTQALTTLGGPSGTMSSMLGAVAGRSLAGRPGRLSKITAAAQAAGQYQPALQMKVFQAIAPHKRGHGISSRDIRSFNRVLSLVSRVDKHIHKHGRR
jgi:hypothetical protein